MALRDRIVVKLGLDPDQFNRQLKTTERRLKNTARGLESWGRKASMVSLPIAAAGGAAIKVATDYEASLTKIKTLVGINAKQVDDWGKQILEKSGDLGRGPNELAEALFFVTSAGLRSAAALDVVEMSAKASVVGLGNTAIVAKLVVSAMQAYSKSNLTAKDSVDALMATVRFGNIEQPVCSLRPGEGAEVDAGGIRKPVHPHRGAQLRYSTILSLHHDAHGTLPAIDLPKSLSVDRVSARPEGVRYKAVRSCFADRFPVAADLGARGKRKPHDIGTS